VMSYRSFIMFMWT